MERVHLITMSKYLYYSAINIIFIDLIVTITSSVSTTGGPLDRNRRVVFPLPTALAAEDELAPRLPVLGPIPSAK